MKIARLAILSALFCATFAAFFVSQRLKNAPPILSEWHGPTASFSPLGSDRSRRVASFEFAVERHDRATVSIIDDEGREVRRLKTEIDVVPGHKVRLTWDGKTGSGKLAHEGNYYVRVSLHRKARSMTLPQPTELITSSARAVVITANRKVADKS